MCYYSNIFEHAHATKLYGGFYYKTVRGAHYQTTQRGAGFEFCGEKHLPFFNYQIAGGRGKALWCWLLRIRPLLLHTPPVMWSSFSVGKAVEVPLPNCTAADDQTLRLPRNFSHLHFPGEGKFLSSQLATILTFKYGGGGKGVTWPGEWWGYIYSWTNFTSPGTNLTVYYSWLFKLRSLHIRLKG